MWKPENYGKKFYGPSTLRVGLEKSRNLMTVRIAQSLGLEKIINFSKQLKIYEIVLEAMNTAIDNVKPGNDIMKPQEISEKVITKGLVKLGLLDGDPDELHEKGAFKDFYMHKIGHWLGLDVHDVGDYMEDGEFMQFKPGMITTIEPGIYISSSMNVDDKWKGIGIRIEDDILVTNDGNINLTEKVPSCPKEIESLMA